MPQIAGLTRQYIQVKREKTNTVSYGGDQGFFREASGSAEDERKKRLGCGIIAFCDLLLYLAGTDPVYQIQEIKRYSDRMLTESEYKACFNFIYEFLGGLPKKGSKGLSGFRLSRKFNRMAGDKNWKLKAIWGWSGRKLFQRMTRMLERDIPVILCIPMMLFKKDKGKGAAFYKKEEKTYRRACTVSEHYVVVTEIIEEKEGIYLGVSSWGEKYYVNWKEYEELIHTHFLGTILGNILYIK